MVKKSVIAIITTCLALSVVLCPGVSAQATRANEKAVIEENIRASIGWALTKDRPIRSGLEICAGN